MAEVFSITAPIYLLLLGGYLAVRAGLWARSDAGTFGKLVLYFALPCLLFNALAKAGLSNSLQPAYLLAYGLGSLLTLGIGFLVLGGIDPDKRARAVCGAMGMCSSNSSFVGLPILLLALPEVATGAFVLNLLVENLLILPLSLVLLEASARGVAGKRPSLLQRLAGNPLIIAIILGLTAGALDWHPPVAVGRAIDLLGQACTALALMAIGGMLHGIHFGSALHRIAPIVCGKLLLHPLLVLLLFSLLHLLGFTVSAFMRQAGMLFAAMPVMSIYPLLVQDYGDESEAAAVLLSTTLLSFLTINLFLLGISCGWL